MVGASKGHTARVRQVMQNSFIERQYEDEPSSSGSEDGDGFQHSPTTLSLSSSGCSQGRNNRQSRNRNPPVTSANSSKSVSSRYHHDARRINTLRQGNSQDDRSLGGSSGDESLSYVQLDAYSVDPKILFDMHDSHLGDVSRIVRTQVFSRVKFLPQSGKEHEKIFGSFWRPNLLVDTPGYVNAVLDNFSDLKERRNDEAHLTDAVNFWMKAAPVVRKVILDRRSNVTQRMKKELVIGIEHLRLKKLGQSVPDEEFFKKNPSYNNRVLNGLMSILQNIGSTGDPSFLEESYDPSEVLAIIRTQDINVFETFCVLCLKHIVGTSVWRQNFRRETISNAFTISDEAFAFLILDNNKDYWKLCYEVGEHNIPLEKSASTTTPVGRRSSKRRKIATKYTKRGSVGGTQGWNQEGIDTYNSLLHVVIANRRKQESKDLEKSLKRQWNEDKLNHLQDAGRVLNQDDDLLGHHPTVVRHAEIVDNW